MTSERNNITSGAPSAPPTPAVLGAAMWLAGQSTPPAPLIPTLRAKFGLTAGEACAACELANTFRLRRAAHA